jgi:hypothetical protein
LQQSVRQLADLFSIAVGKSLPVSHKDRAKRERTVKDATFQNFVRNLLIHADWTGGSLTFEKNIGRGTLIDAINLLAEHLPSGVVPPPDKLPLSTLQRIKSRYRDFYTDAVSPPNDTGRRTT